MTELEFLNFHVDHLFCTRDAPSLATPEEVIADWQSYCEFTDESPIKSLDEYASALKVMNVGDINEEE